ncbi:MAG TPA: NAD(P)(+) transhydrogenase (Re/Si-specific) subunit alpha, partial [Candidatus Xenobia bacterium]
AVVEAFDTRPVVKEQVQSLGASFVELEVDHANAQDAGGYAKELSADHIQKEKELLAKHCKEADVVITTALIPGKPAPRLIPESTVQAMKPGSVIIDLAAEMGGNCEVTKPGEEIVVHNVKICGILNLPALLPFDASAMYSRNVLTLLNHLAPKGELVLNFEDEITKGTCSTHDGNFINPQVKAMMEAQTAKAAS